MVRREQRASLPTEGPANVAHIVRSTVAEVIGVDAADLDDHASWDEDLGGDSLQKLEVVVRLERTLDLSIEDELEHGFDTIADLIAILRRVA